LNLVAFVNHNSYAIAAAIVLAVAGVEIVRRGATWRRIALFAGLAALLTLPPLYVRSGASVVFSADAVDRAIASGRPTLLEVYSDF